ncbi:unnamed protein product, partial [Ectocarpus sp. 12 AP-2014]
STDLILINDNQATVNIIDNDGLPGVSGLTINDITVNEEDGTATLTVTLIGQLQDEFTVDYTTEDDTAVATEDYSATSGQLTFLGNNGETQTLTIPIIDDVILENLENLNIKLSTLSTTVISIIDPVGVITIIDNEYDTDGDNVPDVTDLDDDNDGI